MDGPSLMQEPAPAHRAQSCHGPTATLSNRRSAGHRRRSRNRRDRRRRDGCPASRSSTIRTARTSGENLLIVLLVVAPSSQELGLRRTWGELVGFSLYGEVVCFPIDPALVASSVARRGRVPSGAHRGGTALDRVVQRRSARYAQKLSRFVCRSRTSGSSSIPSLSSTARTKWTAIAESRPRSAKFVEFMRLSWSISRINDNSLMHIE